MLDDALQVRFADKGKAAAAAAAVFIYPPGGQKFFREFNVRARSFCLSVIGDRRGRVRRFVPAARCFFLAYEDAYSQLALLRAAGRRSP